MNLIHRAFLILKKTLGIRLEVSQREALVNKSQEGSIVRGQVLGTVRGGFIVDIGMKAFLPGSQMDIKRTENPEEFIGKVYNFKILTIDVEGQKIIVSRRKLIEEERAARKAKTLKSLRRRFCYRAVVTNITDFGVFFDLNGVDGLLYKTDITWRRNTPSSVNIGDEFEVMVLSINHEKERVQLGLKQNENNPWEDIEKQYLPGTKVHGKIVHLTRYAAFLEIEQGLEGRIHVSEMSWTQKTTVPSEMFCIGDNVEAIVLSVQKDTAEISLGIKQLSPSPWEEAEKKYHIGIHVAVEVRAFQKCGILVELEPDIQGFIHRDDCSWTNKSKPSKMFKKGDKIEALILSIDKELKQINLGIKQLHSNPWETFELNFPVGSLKSGIVTNIKPFGAFVDLYDGIQGMIHLTELSDQPFDKIEDILRVGDQISVKVMSIDLEHKKVGLSIKS